MRFLISQMIFGRQRWPTGPQFVANISEDHLPAFPVRSDCPFQVPEPIFRIFSPTKWEFSFPKWVNYLMTLSLLHQIFRSEHSCNPHEKQQIHLPPTSSALTLHSPSHLASNISPLLAKQAALPLQEQLTPPPPQVMWGVSPPSHLSGLPHSSSSKQRRGGADRPRCSKLSKLSPSSTSSKPRPRRPPPPTDCCKKQAKKKNAARYSLSTTFSCFSLRNLS